MSASIPPLPSGGSLRLAAKAAFVGFLTLLLLIPLAMINGTIRERQAYRDLAVAAVAESYAGPQSLAGPVLLLPYVDEVPVHSTNADGEPVTRIEKRQDRLVWFPATLRMDGRLLPAVRKRGLHQVRVYELRSTMDARFRAIVPPTPSGIVRRFGRPVLSFAIADVRGLVGAPELLVDGQRVALAQGSANATAATGLHAALAPAKPGTTLAFGLRFASTLGGTESLRIAPVADSNRIDLSSSWPHPQFSGRFLPREREVDGNGFRARWELSSLAAGTQQQVSTGQSSPDALAVSLVDPVNAYSQADRASKYGVLFVVLTFVGFFMFELVRGLRIHPIQYALVGLALAIFFLLLIALSEHLVFGLAYLLASAACLGLLAAYTGAILRSAWRGMAFAAGLGLLYAALYGLLVSEDNALVLGALMLFVILATLMLATRKVDWYAQAAGGQA